MSDKPRVLVIDDEPMIRLAVADALRDEGFETLAAENGKEGLELLKQAEVGIVVTDLKLPDMNGLDILKESKARDETIEVIIITAYGSVDSAVEAMKNGAFDYLTKPFPTEELILIMGRLLEIKHLRQENIVLKEAIQRESETKTMLGKSPRMGEIRDLIETVSQVDTTVMIYGESGTGKELVAHAIHHAGPRRAAPFIKVNCAALPETLLESELFGHEKGAFTGAFAQKKGRFELAHHGTLFLDEIGDVSPGVQIKLLRVLQERQIERVGGTRTQDVDVRIICATQRNLKNEIEAGRFREDLYFRLNVVAVNLPPLRERVGDILLLAEHFIRFYSKHMGRPPKQLSGAALEHLLKYPYPGNIRELENAMERAVALSKNTKIGPEDLPPEFHSLEQRHSTDETWNDSRPLATAVKAFEKQYIENMLHKMSGKKGMTSSLLGISRKTLWEKIKEYGIDI